MTVSWEEFKDNTKEWHENNMHHLKNWHENNMFHLKRWHQRNVNVMNEKCGWCFKQKKTV
jgi:hypothetical protein